VSVFYISDGKIYRVIWILIVILLHCFASSYIIQFDFNRGDLGFNLILLHLVVC